MSSSHPSKRQNRDRPSAPEAAPNTEAKTKANAGAWVPVVLGVVLVWPWLASMVCAMTGVCLSPGNHRKDGWISSHAIESSGWRLMLGVMAIGGGISALGSKRRS
jgi:hypothetical protein